MRSQYSTMPLGRVATLRSGYPFKSADWTETGCPVIKIANVKAGRVVPEGCAYVSDHTASAASDWWTAEGDVLIAMTGYVGEVALVRKGQRFLVNQRVGRFGVPSTSPVLAHYLFYVLQHPEVRGELENLARGSAQPNLSAKDAERIEIPVPDKESQKAIVDVLLALDDRIDLLRETQATLECITQALFKSWFIDFDPVLAKAEGREPDGMDGVTAELFPAEFEESTLGPIPKGWSACCVSAIASLSGGKQLDRDEFDPDAPNPIFGGAGEMGKTAQSNADGFVLTVGRVGAYCGQFFWHDGAAWVNNNASLVRPHLSDDSYWVHQALAASDIDRIKKGAAQPFVSNSDIERLPLVLPDNAVRLAFCELAKPLYQKHSVMSAQLRTTDDLRRTLLSRLISGRISLPQAEAQLEETMA